MTKPRILVIGGTGRLGAVVTSRLRQQPVSIRLLTRRPEAAPPQGPGVELLRGDIAVPEDLRHAMTGVDRVFLLSPIEERMATLQIASIDAAEAAGAQRIVKISGSDWTFSPDGTFSGKAHKAIEDRLAASRLEWTALRPNAWMQWALAHVAATVLSGKPLYDPFGGARVGYTHTQDIADVAIHLLIAPSVVPGPHVLTGPEALSMGDVADLAAAILGQKVAVTTDIKAAEQVPFLKVAPFERSVVDRFLALMSDGRSSTVNDAVERFLGRQPIAVRDYLTENFSDLANRQ